jgi:CMP-N-acetylneuraminic acid synthetase
VPRKNFITIDNSPLWEILIDKLRGEEVYLNTDSSEILEGCKNKSWVTLIKRNLKHIEMENKSHISPATDMIFEFLNKFVSDETEIIVTPHCTSPFIKKETILKAIGNMQLGGYDSVEAVTSHQHFAYLNGEPVNFDPTVIQKTQNLEPIELSNGAFFAFTKKCFIENQKNRRGKISLRYSISFPESLEIDSYEDVDILNLLKERSNNRND